MNRRAWHPLVMRLLAAAGGGRAIATRLALGSLLYGYCACAAPMAARDAPTATARGKQYGCAPCGSPCDAASYDHAGTCPSCGMPLIERGATQAQAPASQSVGILVFDGAEIIDFTGPWEVFGAADFNVYTVAASGAPVTTSMGMKIVPNYTFDSARAPDILLVPGGGVDGARNSPATLRWVRKASSQAELTLSVCNGAFILASAGLLDGLTATTTSHLIEKLKREFPGTHVVSDRRFVDNGKIITAAGLSSGIDGALHVVEKAVGKGTAQAVALGLEYNWQPESQFVRAALADRLLPDMGLDDLGTWTADEMEGTPDRWEMRLRGAGGKSAKEVLGAILDKAARDGRWRVAASTETSANLEMNDESGKAWSWTVSVEPLQQPGHLVALRVHVERAAQ